MLCSRFQVPPMYTRLPLRRLAMSSKKFARCCGISACCWSKAFFLANSSGATTRRSRVPLAWAARSLAPRCSTSLESVVGYAGWKWDSSGSSAFTSAPTPRRWLR
ncbi:hypothetical protein D9M69_574080 [compost metagenome]